MSHTAESWALLSPEQKVAYASTVKRRGKANPTCVEHGCDRPAGTPWTALWCWQHDEERLARITAKMEAMRR